MNGKAYALCMAHDQIHSTPPYVNLLACSSDDEAKSELQVADVLHVILAELKLKSVAMTSDICCVSGSKVGKCGLASS
jgi:hypothetical protein